MTDLALYASDVLGGLLSLIGTLLFFIFVLPPFIIIFVPILIVSSTALLSGIGLYVTYIAFRVGWEMVKSLIYHVWPSQRPAVAYTRRPRRRSVYEMRQDIAALSELVELDKERRQQTVSGLHTPARRIAQPRSRSGSMHLKKSDSLRSLVGPSSDHDFEDMGGWAASHEDDEAMYMSRNMGIHEAVYTPGVLHGSSISLHNHSPTGTRTPAAAASTTSRPVSRDEPWKFTAGGTGATTPKAQHHNQNRSGAVTPDSYFQLSPMQSRFSSQIMDLTTGNAYVPTSPSKHRKTASVTSMIDAPPTDVKNNQRDSGFFG